MELKWYTSVVYNKNIPNTIDNIRMCNQLKYSGVIEAIRISRAGYPVRLTYTEFLNRYWKLTLVEYLQED